MKKILFLLLSLILIITTFSGCDNVSDEKQKEINGKIRGRWVAEIRDENWNKISVVYVEFKDGDYSFYSGETDTLITIDEYTGTYKITNDAIILDKSNSYNQTEILYELSDDSDNGINLIFNGFNMGKFIY